MGMLRGLKSCAKLNGVAFVWSFGQEPNWFARPRPSRVSDACMREFVTALARVRKEFDRSRAKPVSPSLPPASKP
jgi:hypothetical protein